MLFSTHVGYTAIAHPFFASPVQPRVRICLSVSIEIGIVTGHAQRLLETLGGRNRPARASILTEIASIRPNAFFRKPAPTLRWLAGSAGCTRCKPSLESARRVDGGCVGWQEN